jgi:hypothetical protein
MHTSRLYIPKTYPEMPSFLITLRNCLHTNISSHQLLIASVSLVEEWNEELAPLFIHGVVKGD